MSAVPDGKIGWGLELEMAACPKCRAAFLVPPTRASGTCPNCFASTLALQPIALPAEPPELLAPFVTTPAQATEVLDRWARTVWLRPSEMNASTLAGRLTRSFIPMWLVDGTVLGAWCAQMGYDYQVASSQEVFQGGAWTTRELAETRVRWEPRAGQINRRYENQAAPALDNHLRLIAAVGDYAPTRSMAYSADSLQGAVVRAPNVAPDAARPVAEQGLNREAEKDCQAAAGAQHLEHWALQAEYKDLNWTLLLLPLYTTFYTDEQGTVIPVLIHGQSGRISGLKRASQKQGKQLSLALGALALIVLVLAAAAALLASTLPQAVYAAALLLLSGFVIAVAAPIPFLWAWHYNRTNTR